MFVRVCVYVIVGVIQGFLWVHHLQALLVLQQLQQFQVVRLLPSLRALLEDPANMSIGLFVHSWMHSVSKGLVRCTEVTQTLTFFPGSPTIPGGPPSPGSPCGENNSSYSLRRCLFLRTPSITCRKSTLMLANELYVCPHLLSIRSRITQTTRRTLRTLINTSKTKR